MNKDEKAELERQAGRKLTDGEAEEIDHQPIVQRGSGGLGLGDTLGAAVVPVSGGPIGQNGQT